MYTCPIVQGVGHVAKCGSCRSYHTISMIVSQHALVPQACLCLTAKFPTYAHIYIPLCT